MNINLMLSHPYFARSNRAQMSLAGLLASGSANCFDEVAFLPGDFTTSGSLRNKTGNSGATAADLHRFPFSPESLHVCATHRTPRTLYSIDWKAMWQFRWSQIESSRLQPVGDAT
jgi:hypothetical protein